MVDIAVNAILVGAATSWGAGISASQDLMMTEDMLSI
jgi:hypothetical protein